MNVLSMIIVVAFGSALLAPMFGEWFCGSSCPGCKVDRVVMVVMAIAIYLGLAAVLTMLIMAGAVIVAASFSGILLLASAWVFVPSAVRLRK